MRGYTGKILWVDLSAAEIHEEHIPDSVYETVLSGVGLGAAILYNRIPAGADPLRPENVLGFVSGLLTGTPSLVTGRWMVVCKSPITGGWGDANCGGNFSPAIKQCGYDGIFFTGAASTPVYLYVDHHKAEIRPADHVWGMDAVQAEERLIHDNSKPKKPAVAVIGPAAEKLSLISGIANDGGRIAARSGCGAVMGSKHLKGVVLAGNNPIGCQDAHAMKAISRELAAKIRRMEMPRFFPGILLALMGRVMGKMKKAAPLDGMILPMLLKRWGTPMNNLMGATSGDTPIKNWAGSVADYARFEYHSFNPDQVLRLQEKKYHCYSCVIGCGGVCNLSEATGNVFTSGHKPEYETCAAFGGLLLNRDLKTILYINELLNRAGMDTISTGATVAFAIECYEKGVITPDMTGGLKLAWGDAPSIIELVQLMIERKGIGDLLADGTKAAAARLGDAATSCLVTAGGQEPGMHDSRMDPVVGVHYSVDPTPGRHTVGSGQYYDMMHLWDKVSWAPNPGLYDKSGEYLDTDQMAYKTAANACYKGLTDGAGGCLFAMVMGVHHWKLFDWLNAATGWQKTPDDWMEIGQNIQTLRQLFNIKQGIRPIDFKMSRRMAGDPPLAAGPNKGKTLPIEAMMRRHWKVMGWDEQSGIPLSGSVEKLQQAQVIPHQDM